MVGAREKPESQYFLDTVLILLEKIPLAGIARVTQVSNSWLQYVNDAYAKVARRASVVPKTQGQLTYKWMSFVCR